MAWKLVRQYRCTLCGKEETESSIGLPLTWTGSGNEEGDAYCDECTRKLNSIGTCRFLSLDGDNDRLVCSNCGTSFDVLDLSEDGNTPPHSCPKCGMRISRFR